MTGMRDRAAGFELLTEIGSLQQIIFYAHFAEDDEAYRRIDEAIDARRQTTLESLRALK